MNTKKTADKVAMGAAVLMIALLLAVAAFAQGAAFRFFGPLSRVITPNGDVSKNNGTAIFCFDNPADSGVSGSVFSLLGSAVATMPFAPRKPPLQHNARRGTKPNGRWSKSSNSRRRTRWCTTRFTAAAKWWRRAVRSWCCCRRKI